MKQLNKKTILFLILSLLFVVSCILLYLKSKLDAELENEQIILKIKDIVSSTDSSTAKLANINKTIKQTSYFWYIIGFLGEGLFGSRMIVQWIASEKAKKNVFPAIFWYLSLAGSLLVLIYAIHIKDPVFILSKSFGFLIYIRNIVLFKKEDNS